MGVVCIGHIHSRVNGTKVGQASILKVTIRSYSLALCLVFCLILHFFFLQRNCPVYMSPSRSHKTILLYLITLPYFGIFIVIFSFPSSFPSENPICLSTCNYICSCWLQLVMLLRQLASACEECRNTRGRRMMEGNHRHRQNPSTSFLLCESSWKHSHSQQWCFW